jgi:hypothetical protein
MSKEASRVHIVVENGGRFYEFGSMIIGEMNTEEFVDGLDGNGDIADMIVFTVNAWAAALLHSVRRRRKVAER